MMVVQYKQRGDENMKKIKRDEEAVSPVIGVILMVVITVILATIIAVFAFGIGTPAKAPNANLKYAVTNSSVSAGEYNLTIKVSNIGGDSLVLNNTRITVFADDEKTYVKDEKATAGIDSFPMYGSDLTGAFQITDRTLAPGKYVARSVKVSGSPQVGDILVIKVVDVPSGQLISDARVTVQ